MLCNNNLFKYPKEYYHRFLKCVHPDSTWVRTCTWVEEGGGGFEGAGWGTQVAISINKDPIPGRAHQGPGWPERRPRHRAQSTKLGQNSRAP
jgi:hypothetical protein